MTLHHLSFIHYSSTNTWSKKLYSIKTSSKLEIPCISKTRNFYLMASSYKTYLSNLKPLVSAEWDDWWLVLVLGASEFFFQSIFMKNDQPEKYRKNLQKTFKKRNVTNFCRNYLMSNSHFSDNAPNCLKGQGIFREKYQSAQEKRKSVFTRWNQIQIFTPK